MERQEAKTLNELLCQFVSESGLSKELEKVRIYETWDNVVGSYAANATIRKYYSNGILYCTLSSSVLRSQIYFQADSVIEKMNSLLGKRCIMKLVLK